MRSSSGHQQQGLCHRVPPVDGPLYQKSTYFFGPRGAARFTGLDDGITVTGKGTGEPLDLSGLSGPFAPFEGDELSGFHADYFEAPHKR